MNTRLRCAGMVLVALLLAAASHAQVQVVNSLITTFAGAGSGCAGQTDSIGDGCPAANSTLRVPTGDALDFAGNLFIADANDNVIRKVSAATGEITTVAGSGTGCTGQTDSIGDGCPATSATLSTPYGVAVDAARDLFIIDQANMRIREVSAATGKIATVAGNGSSGYTGDNNPAINAEFRNPSGIAVNPAGTVIYIGDSGNNVVRMVNLTTGIITTFAGNGDGAGDSFFNGSYTDDNGSPTSAELWNPTGVALDAKGNLYIADTYDSVIRMVSATTGNISTVAGNGTLPSFLGDSGDGGLATNGVLFFPNGVTVDAAGDLFIADTSNCLIREVNAVTGIITTVVGVDGNVGQAQGEYGGDNGPALLASLNLPDDVAVDSAGNLYIADSQNNVVRKVTAPNSPLSLPATDVGAASAPKNVLVYFGAYYTAQPGQFPTEVPITLSGIGIPPSVAGAQEFTIGTLSGCVADGETPINAGTICTVPVTFKPGYSGLQEAPLELQTNAGPFYFGLSGIGMGPEPALLPGLITTVAGTGATGYTGDNGPAIDATFNSVFAVALDYAGNEYIDDYTNDVFRKVTAATGIVTTFAGDGTQGYAGDYGPATGAELQIDWNAGTDAAGNVYIADTNNNVIREVNAATGIITTVVGDCCAANGPGNQGYNGDGIPAVGAELFFPESVATDTSGNLYIADYGNNRIREVNAATGIITTVAGNGIGSGAKGTGGYTGDNGPATSAELNGPSAVALDSAGNIYFADFYNDVIRKVTVATGIITTVAGDGTFGLGGDNGPATSAELASPIGIAVDAAGNLYIDSNAGNVRKVDVATGIIATIVGGGTGCTGETDSIGDGCGATSANISAQNLGLDPIGNLYIADSTNNRVREVAPTTAPITFPETAAGSSSLPITFKVANVGNAPLNLSAITPSANFSVDPGTTTCSTSDAVPFGGSCVIGVVFSPTTGGASTGTLTLTDNALNVAGSTQQVALNGTIGTSSSTPDFTITTFTPTQEVSQGGDSANYVLTITAEDGFGGMVALGVTGDMAMGVTMPASVTIPPGGSQNFNVTLTSALSPSGTFPFTITGSTVGGLQHSVVISLIVDKPALTPTVTVTPASSIITTAQALIVTVTVNGGSGNPTATGYVTLTSGTYTGAATLSGGSATINIPAGALAIALDTLTATYTPDEPGALNYANATGSNTVKVTAPSLSFVSNVGTALPSQPVTVNITTLGTLNTIQVLTQGQPSLDFTETSGGTCATTTAYTVSETCTVNVIFKPRVPGARPGAVLLTDASNDILGIAYLPGTGIGPEITFSPGVQSTLPSYSGQNAAVPVGVAVDAGLNVYVADLINNWIIKMPWTGSAYGAPVQLPFTGLYTPEGVAVDGAGDVFAADEGNSRVVELPWNGSSYGTQIVVASYGFEHVPTPSDVAVDSHGNLFFVVIGYGTVPSALIEMPWTGSGYGSPTTITAATGLNSPDGVAVDANLNIYIADTGNNRVVEIPWNGTSFGTEIVVVSGIFGAGVAVDGGGDVYITNGSSSPVVEVPWNGTAFGTPVTVPFALVSGADLYGIAVDGYGNLYVSSDGYERVVELNVSTPPSLGFASTNVGSVSTDSPQTVAVSNIGNAPLTFSLGNDPNYPTDFPENSSGTSLCASASPLTQGGSCNVSINFKPTTTGPLSEDVVLTDNNLNGSNVTQSIAVSGTGTAGTLTPQTINFTQPATPVTWASGLTIPLVATGGASGNPVVFTIDGSSTGKGSISGSTLNVTNAGAFVIDANQAGNATYTAAPQVQRTVVVNQAAQTITFTQPTSAVIYSGTSVNVPLSATGGASGNAVVFTIDGSSTGTGSISGSTLTVTSVGNFVIDANQAGNTNYSAAAQVQRTVIANSPNAQTINFTQPTTPVTYSSGLTIPLVATGGASGNPVVFTIDGSSTGTGSITGSTLNVTNAGTFVIDANQAGNASYTAAPQVQKTVAVNQALQAINFTQPTSPVIYSGTSVNVPLSATGGASGNAVVFTIDGSSTGTGTISGSTLTVTSTGNLVIDANQAGNVDYSTAPQVQKTIVVNAPVPDFKVTTTTTSQSVQPGGTTTFPITVADVGASFTGTVTLSVSGLPTGATGSFSPPTITPGSEGGSSTLTVTLPATANLARPNFWPVATPVMALLFMLPFRRWSKVWRGKLLLLVAGLASLACAASFSGCGGGFGLIQSQTYTLTITGTSGVDTHSTTVQLTVQQ
jgi:trimeric autotransporter adhesin